MGGTFAPEALMSQCAAHLANLNFFSLGNSITLQDLPGHFSSQLRCCDAITFTVYSGHVPRLR
jgi:hypothetical protein